MFKKKIFRYLKKPCILSCDQYDLFDVKAMLPAGKKKEDKCCVHKVQSTGVEMHCLFSIFFR